MNWGHQQGWEDFTEGHHPPKNQSRMPSLLWKGNIDLEMLHKRQADAEVEDPTWYPPGAYSPGGRRQRVAPAWRNLAPPAASQTSDHAGKTVWFHQYCESFFRKSYPHTPTPSIARNKVFS